MKEKLKDLCNRAEQAFSKVIDSQKLEELRIEFLGAKSEIQAFQKSIASLTKEEKPVLGKLINESRKFIEEKFNTIQEVIAQKALEKELKEENIDISLPGILNNLRGAKHPLTLITQEIVSIFESMGFQEMDSPEVETEYYNFTGLNTPESHPARDEQDTFYTNINSHVVMRSHVSPFQVRVLEKEKLPLRVISHGRVYRNEEINPRKLPFFHQLEILCVDENITFNNLKWTLQNFFNQFFNAEIPIRLRPDFFPFTEPSAEVDAQCVFCKGKGCQTCGYKGWLELLGCGLVDPNVLEMSNIDTKKYTGFAAGLGIERFAMLKYGISDIRDFYSGDIRFLNQFSKV